LFGAGAACLLAMGISLTLKTTQKAELRACWAGVDGWLQMSSFAGFKQCQVSPRPQPFISACPFRSPFADPMTPRPRLKHPLLNVPSASLERCWSRGSSPSPAVNKAAKHVALVRGPTQNSPPKLELCTLFDCGAGAKLGSKGQTTRFSLFAEHSDGNWKAEANKVSGADSSMEVTEVARSELFSGM
jgi:hypothetical protein